MYNKKKSIGKYKAKWSLCITTLLHNWCVFINTRNKYYYKSKLIIVTYVFVQRVTVY